MKQFRQVLTVAALLVLFLFVSSSVSYAQATRTWVSGVGDDANPCSRTAPCKTFAGAISKTAAGGEIDVLDPGGFGTLTIGKSLTIDGGAGQVASVLASGVNGFVINTAGVNVNVTLRNLTVNGTPNGLNGLRWLNAGGNLHIENVVFFGFTQNGIDLEPQLPTQVFISDTIVHDNGNYGVNVSPAAGGTANVSMNRVQALNNFVGIWGQDGSNVTIVNSLVAGNSHNGIKAHSGGGAAKMNISYSTATNNGTPALTQAAGVKSDGNPSIVYIGNNTIVNNTNGLFVSGGGLIISFGNNNIGGNGTDGSPTSTIGTH
jgi:hypothetical protein